MKKNRILSFIILFLIFLSIFLSGCKSSYSEKATKEKAEKTIKEPAEETTNEKEIAITESGYFEMPDEIIIYDKGVQSYIEKDTELYNKIVYITDKRFERECGLSEEMITEEMINDNKNKLAIEFIYSKKMQTIYKCFDYSWKKNYTKILFPLPDSRAIFGDEEKYQNCPWHITIHPEAGYLISIIEEEFGN